MAEPSPAAAAASPGPAEGGELLPQSSLYAGELIPPSFYAARKRRMEVAAQQQGAGGPRLSLTRLTCAMTLTPSGTLDDAVALLREGVAACDGASGLCLGIGRGIVNVLECPADDAMAFLGRIRDHVKHPDTATIKCATVLAACEDCPNRVFAGWECRFVKKPRESGIDLASEGAFTVGNAVYTGLITLGNKLTERKLSAEDYASALNNLKQYFAEYVPSSERVVALAEAEDLMDVAEYIELYGSPVNLQLESDNLWPVQAVISDYI